MRTPPRWTALGVAEATVIGGTSIACLALMVEKAEGRGLDGDDGAVLATTQLITVAAALAIGRRWGGGRRGTTAPTVRADRTTAGPAP